MAHETVDTNLLKEKILKGIEKAFEKLIQTKKKMNGEIVFSRNGQIERIKANEI